MLCTTKIYSEAISCVLAAKFMIINYNHKQHNLHRHILFSEKTLIFQTFQDYRVHNKIQALKRQSKIPDFSSLFKLCMNPARYSPQPLSEALRVRMIVPNFAEKRSQLIYKNMQNYNLGAFCEAICAKV